MESLIEVNNKSMEVKYMEQKKLNSRVLLFGEVLWRQERFCYLQAGQ